MIDQESQEMPAQKQTTDEKLDEIIHYLHLLNRRDRMRLISSSIHSVLWLISTVFVLFGAWYFTTHAPQMIGEMMKQMVQQSVGGGSNASSAGWMQQFQDYMKGQK